MALQFDPSTGKITYRGKVVGEHIYENGRSIVRLNIEYEGGDDWIVPLSGFASGLAALDENRPPQAELTINTPEDEVEQEFDVVRFLTEKQVKRNGYVWAFHKNDADNWPSPLHGHDYDKGLKLDAITGDIYDVGTKQRCKTLKSKHLNDIQEQLRESKDFKDKVSALVDDRPKT